MGVYRDCVTVSLYYGVASSVIVYWELCIAQHLILPTLI
jgi:hypothetical protein